MQIGNLLASEVYKFLLSGLTLEQLKVSNLIKPNMTDKDYLKAALNNKLKESYTKKYKEMLQFIFNKPIEELKDSTIQSSHIELTPSTYKSESSYNAYRLRLCSLINEARKIRMTSNPMHGIKSKKANAQMHKLFDNINEILESIKNTTNSYIHAA